MFMMIRTLSEQITAFFMAKSVHSCPRASSTSGRSAASEAELSLTAWRTVSTVVVCSLRHLSKACITSAFTQQISTAKKVLSFLKLVASSEGKHTAKKWVWTVSKLAVPW